MALGLTLWFDAEQIEALASERETLCLGSRPRTN